MPALGDSPEMHVDTQSAGDGSEPQVAKAGAGAALALLLAINLFNYIDRYILAALEEPIRREFGLQKSDTGWLPFAFLITYMLISPVFGLLADKMHRWTLIGIGVILWSLASGGSGVATTFGMLLFMRCVIGVGEAAYGPVAPTLISDLYPTRVRGKVLSLFYAAIPVGSALGFAIGGMFVAHWHWAFYLTVPPGIVLGICCFLMREPRAALDTTSAAAGGMARVKPPKPTLADYTRLLSIKSYVIDSLGMTAMTFAIGGVAFWMPTYLSEDRHVDPAKASLIFGGITVVAGLIATIAGGMVGDALRKRYSGSYFLVSGLGMLIGTPLFLLILVTPFPACWAVIFAAVFFLFFNTGPSNTILANVTPAPVRATAFALNILMIHLFGDAISPLVMGVIADHSHMSYAFVFVSVIMALGGVIWLFGVPHLASDTAAVEAGSAAT